jgi:hypothetical protein
MVSITKSDKNFIFEIKGMHKLWALKSEIIIPSEHIVKVYQDETQIKDFNFAKIIGTNIPFGLHAGTFYKDGGVIFMDVSDKKKAIILDLKDEKYKQMIIEVENPSASLALLNQKL